MKAENLMQAVGELDDAHVLTAKPKKKHILPIAVAACLCVAVIGVAAVRTGKTASTDTNRPPDGVASIYPAADYSLSAETVGGLFSGYAADGETVVYEEVYLRDAAPYTEKIYNQSLPEGETAEIYARESSETSEADFIAFTERYMPAMRALCGVQNPDYTTEVSENYLGETAYSAQCIDMEEDGAFRMIHLYAAGNRRLILFDCGVMLEIDGETPTLSPDMTDEEINASLADVYDYVNQTLGTNHTSVKITRSCTYDGLRSVTVYLYDGDAENLPGSLSTAPITDEYVALTFYTDWGEGTFCDFGTGGELAYLAGIEVRQSATDEYYRSLGSCELLTLAEAEENLSKGYVFGGHSCPLCMQEQQPVDFSGYDAVGFEYYDSLNDPLVPFYTFYKCLGYNSYGMLTYAKTYVCAVHLDDIDAYFAAQEEYHR